MAETGQDVGTLRVVWMRLFPHTAPRVGERLVLDRRAPVARRGPAVTQASTL